MEIELTFDMEQWLNEQAAQAGTEPQEYALRVLSERRAATLFGGAVPRPTRGFGAFADVPLSSDDFAASKREEKAREDRGGTARISARGADTRAGSIPAGVEEGEDD